MNSKEAKAAAKKTGCTLIDQDIALAELNQILRGPDWTNGELTDGRQFADFSLGQRLSAVAVIGTRKQLDQLKVELAL